jgi:general secretion pathway protein C
LNHNPRMSSRWTGFFIWALVAASAAFWSIKIFAAARPVPPGAQAPQVLAANGPMERLFGAVLVPTEAVAAVHPESERFQLVGVIAPPSGVARTGYAIVAIDGQPARTWHVGAPLDGNTSLLAVSKRGAEFGPSGGPTAFSLQLPEPAAAETGTLTPAVSQSDQPQIAPRPPENAQHVAQPPLPAGARGGFGGATPGRAGMSQPNGRGGFQGPQGGAAPPNAVTPTQPDATPPLQQ